MHEIFWYQASGIRRGIDIFKNTFPRKRFLSIMKYLRFDEKNRRRERLQTDKFSLASQIWEPFISNCQKAFNPGQNLTIDEHCFLVRQGVNSFNIWKTNLTNTD